MDSFYKKLVWQIGSAGAIIIFLWGGVYFFRVRITDYANKVSVGRIALIQNTINIESFAFLKAQYTNKGRQDMNTLLAFVPQRDQLINLVGEFKAIADKVRVRSSLQFSGETPATDEAFGSLKFTLSLQGTTDDLLQFMQSLEHFHYLRSIEGFTLTRNDPKSELSLRGQIYFRK